MALRARELVDFIVHLRPHYQLFILSGGYLFGAWFTAALDLPRFVAQFFVVHILLNGGVTAFNSYFDRDEGPIGGLLRPPPMQRWMLWASLAVQLAGLAAAWPMGALYVALYVLTMALSVLYSAPPFRWKGRPLLSLVAVGVGTGTNTFWMGAIAAGAEPSVRLVVAGVGASLLLLAYYPASQLFQIAEDQRRGDRTFAVHFGPAGVRRLFALAYPLGLALTALALSRLDGPLAGVFAAGGTLAGWVLGARLFRMSREGAAYRDVMQLKYLASLGFSLIIALGLLFRHGGANVTLP